MSLIEPVKQASENLSGNKKNSAALRLWHWANALALSGSLITVLVNSTVLKPRKSAPLVLTEVQKDNPSLTLSQARTAVSFLEDKVWELHVYLGFALTALLLFRLIAEFFEITDRKFINQFKKARLLFKTSQQQKDMAQHSLIVKSIYIAFYILLLIMVITGLSLAFQDNLPFSKDLQHTVKDVHGFCMYLILAFIAVHLAGVFLAERKPESKGIVSDMINGG